MKFRVRVVPEAKAQARRLDAWWRENRPASRTSVKRELSRARDLLSATPHVGARYERDDISGVRRLRLGNTPNHVYYLVDEANAEVVIISAWSSTRGTGPPHREP